MNKILPNNCYLALRSLRIVYAKTGRVVGQFLLYHYKLQSYIASKPSISIFSFRLSRSQSIPQLPPYSVATFAMGAAADAVLYRKLRLQIPRLHLTSLIVRVAQTLLLLSLSTFYALSEPEIFQDVFIWNPAAALYPPYELGIHRNFSRHWKSREMASILGNRTDWPTITVQWNETGPPKGLGLSLEFPCPAGYLGCNGTEMAATRLSWLDSWPAENLPEWLKGSVYLDRYIFWSMIFGVCTLSSIQTEFMLTFGRGFLQSGTT